MKKLYFLVLLFVVGSVNAQDAIINFPDQVFKNRILYPYNGTILDTEGNYFQLDANNNGEIEESEALQVGHIDIDPPSINNLFTSFEGIEYFTNLTYFKCGINTAATADFSSLVNLETLSLFTPNITTINFSENLKFLTFYGSQIPWSDVNTLGNLVHLSLSNNQLTSIDISGLTNLEYLSVYDNNLTTLDLAQHASLKYLHCGYNQLTSLILLNRISSYS